MKNITTAMTVTYEVDGALYLNITTACTNRCDFCIRNNGDGAYGSESLWLDHAPDVDEIKSSLAKRDIRKYKELVFCGYGEPSCRLREAREIALYVKSLYPEMKIRINTNGQSDLILGCDSSPLYRDAFDAVSISLNAPTEERYQQICHSVFGEGVLEAIKLFATRVRKHVSDVKFSVVRQTLTEDELAECEKIAKETGVPLRVRDYIG